MPKIESEQFCCVSDQEACQKFEATFMGSLIGVCIGKKFEGVWGPDLAEIMEDYHTLKYQKMSPQPSDPYNGDMVLALALTESIICSSDFDLANTAQFFQLFYYHNPDQDFSTNNITICKKFKELSLMNDFKENFMLPAIVQFDGKGSFGTGGATRCFPIALITYCRSLDEMVVASELETRLTHSHIWAVLGAQQQSYAIREAFNNSLPGHSFDFENYFLKIYQFVSQLEIHYEKADRLFYEKSQNYSMNMQTNLFTYLQQKERVNQNNEPSNDYYSSVLRKLFKEMKKCRKGRKVNFRDVYEKMGKKMIGPIQSITTALICFLVASDPKCAHELDEKLMCRKAHEVYSPIERVIFYAFTFSGESATICHLAGAITGAFYGRKACPSYLIEMCDDFSKIQVYAKKLFETTNTF